MANFTPSSAGILPQAGFIPRNLTPLLHRALKLSPIVVLQGARQTGKSTLVQTLEINHKPIRYVSLDEASVLAAATRDPVSFVASVASTLVIDEVQRVPDLFLALKAEVDRNRQPGRFLLTGSANALMLPRIADSLAGRVQILTLQPFAQDELVSAQSRFIDALFNHTDYAHTLEPFTNYPIARETLIEKILRGGYPFAIQHGDATDRQLLFNAYITTILQRDVRDLANIESIVLLPQLLALLATRSSALLNLSDLSRSIGIPYNTLRRYLSLLETTFFIWRLPAWSNNLGLRLGKAPKLIMSDTGLMANVIGANQQRFINDPTLIGIFMETFVANELSKLLSWNRTAAQLYHFQTTSQHEVDMVLERQDGMLVGIEVKSSATVSGKDFKGLEVLSQATGPKFLRGIVIYTGERIVPFAPNMLAVPIAALWSAIN